HRGDCQQHYHSADRRYDGDSPADPYRRAAQHGVIVHAGGVGEADRRAGHGGPTGISELHQMKRDRLMNRLLLGSVAVWFCSTFAALGASISFEITVAAGQHERKNIPVRVPVPLDQMDTEKMTSVTLTGPDGKTIPAQLTKPG